MSVQEYKIVYEGGSSEVIEKKSRFIAAVRPAETEEEAVEFINSIKKKYWDASHNCSAFTIGKNHELTRCSDDGEPSGTAGRPMLEVLLREDIHNTVIVVTRYFGGTLLGTGGLVRAYQKAAQAGLAAATVVKKSQGIRLAVETDYNQIGKMQYLLGQRGISLDDTEYTDKVTIRTVIPIGQKKELEQAITEGTGGAAGLCWGDEAEFALISGKLKIFS